MLLLERDIPEKDDFYTWLKCGAFCNFHKEAEGLDYEYRAKRHYGLETIFFNRFGEICHF